MKKSSVSSCWQKKFRKKAMSKQFALHAVAQYYQSRDCNSAVLVGEEIARLQVINVNYFLNELPF